MKLSDVQCRKAAPREKAYKLADGQGLYLHVSSTGHKSWRLKYRFGGKEKLLTIGPYPEISLRAARDACSDARRQLRQHVDPSVERAQRKAEAMLSAEATFRTIAEEWHKTRQAGWNDRYARQIMDRLANHLFPEIGALPIADVTPALVLKAIRKVEATGAFEMAHRVRQHASDVFVHAISTGRREDDPAHVVAKALRPVPKKLYPAVRSIEDARAVLMRVEMQSAYRITKLASRMMALTAARSGVLRLAEPSEFEDLDGPAPIWRIPAAKMKLTQDRKADAAFEFVVPLSSWAVEVVRAAMSLGVADGYLFRSVRSSKKPISDSTLSQLYLDAGLQGKHVPHGWRSTFSTIMNERAAIDDRERDRAIIDLMLAHVPKGVEAAYNRAVYMPRRREIAQQWGDMLMQGLPPASVLLGRA